tara:strand:- start:19 stop:957 length:939 start_codon:yes stop_codon:yes gene_type:complete
MKSDPLTLLINKDFVLDKKFYFISGNETTLIEKIKNLIIVKFRKNKNSNIKNIETVDGLVEQTGLFDNKTLFIGKNCKGLDEKNLNRLRCFNGVFLFIQENSQKIKKIKNVFLKDKDSYLVDCYELDKSSKIKILNNYLDNNKIKIDKELYWMLVERLDDKYMFLENSLNKILELDRESITAQNINKILTIDETGKEKIFFYLLKKNKEIISVYRDKITTNSDVNELFYFCRFFCQLIIESKNQEDYNKKIPIYLFKEKNFLIDVFKKYNSEKKKMLLYLLSSTEKVLRKQSGLSLANGLRFFLNIKKITIS